MSEDVGTGILVALVMVALILSGLLLGVLAGHMLVWLWSVTP